jgi:hypothetical protein
MLIGENRRAARENATQCHAVLHIIPHPLDGDRARDYAVRGRRLTAWSMEWSMESYTVQRYPESAQGPAQLQVRTY